MTMKEIDGLREHSNACLEAYRFWAGHGGSEYDPRAYDIYTQMAEQELERARARVEQALREWWKQGCKEV